MTGGGAVVPGARCQRCGYDLSSTPLGGVCPECGLTYAVAVPARKPLDLCRVSLAVGIAGVVTVFPYGLPGVLIGLAARIFGKRGRIQIQAGQLPLTSAEYARWGERLGLAAIIVGALVAGASVTVLVTRAVSW